jgi:hypothetical protein
MKLNNTKALNHFEGHTKLNLNRLASSNEHHLMTNPTIVNGTLEASRILWLSLSLSSIYVDGLFVPFTFFSPRKC